MSNRELTNFMAESNVKKENVNNSGAGIKDVSIFNIRKNETGLYFNIKIYGSEEKEVNNLFIPSRFYKNNSEITQTSNTSVNKNKLLGYLFVYPAAILSLAVIFAAVFKYLPALQKFFDFSIIY